MTIKKPELWLIAGPNGAGKSTLVAKHNRNGLPIVNPDVIAAGLPQKSNTEKHIQAGRIALVQQRDLMNNKSSFIVETTFSGRAGLRLLASAKAKGYQVNFVYVALKTFRQSQGRVFTRIHDGGHSVPVADIKRRFDRVTENVTAALPSVDRVFVIDNTKRAPLLVAKLKRGKVVRKYPTLPDWLKQRYPVLAKTKQRHLSR